MVAHQRSTITQENTFLQIFSRTNDSDAFKGGKRGGQMFGNNRNSHLNQITETERILFLAAMIKKSQS